MAELAPPANADTGNNPPPPPAPSPQATETRYAVDPELAKSQGLAKYLDDKGTVDINNLAKGYLHAQSMIGADKIVIPKEGDEKGWDEVWSKLGRPEKPDDYKFEKPQLPEGLPYDEEAEKWFRQEAHAQKMTQSAAQALYAKFIQRQVDAFTSYANNYKAEQEAGMSALKKEWGAGYDGQLGLSKAAAREYGGDELVGFLNESGVGNNPVVIKAFAKIGRELMGSGKITTDGKNTITPADLDAQITDFRAKHEKALFDASHPDHSSRSAEYQRLFEQRWPQTAA